MVVAPFKDGLAERIIGRDIDTTFVSQDASFDLPVGKSRTEGERNVFMHRLEGLKDKGVACRCGFNAVGEGGVDEVDEEGRWKESGIGIVGIICGKEVGLAGEGVRASEELSGYMDHFEVKIGKVNKPARLVAVKHLGLTKVGEILMIGEDLHRKRGAVEVVAPGFQGTNDSKEFAIIYVIVAFGGREQL